MSGNIELELRAEVNLRQREKLISYLRARRVPFVRTRRLSVLFFGKTNGHEIDIRVRITNGQAEVVIKKGGFHAHDRMELTQPIATEQFLGMVWLFEQLFTRIKVAERETVNYQLGRGMTIAVVRAGHIVYVELEKITDRGYYRRDYRRLTELAEKFGLTIIHSRRAFNELCDRLTTQVDWTFRPTARYHTKLARIFRRYRSAARTSIMPSLVRRRA